MRKSRSNNPNGRPKEYREKLRTISLALPELLIAAIDQIGDEAGISRQRVIMEWLIMARMLDAFGYMRTTSEHTHFDEWKKFPSKIEGHTNIPMTYKAAAEWFGKWAETMPDELISSIELFVTRDQLSSAHGTAESTTEKPLKAAG